MEPSRYALFAIVSGLAFPCLAESIDKIAPIRPADKEAIKVSSKERNPYTVRNIPENDEKLAIMKKIGQLTVTGQKREFGDFRMILGDILIKRGVVLPQLIPKPVS